MPPEVKPVISSFAEMTCENCVYSVNEPLQQRFWCRNDHNGYGPRTPTDHFCSRGRWLVCNNLETDTNDEEEPWPTNFINCYYLFGRQNAIPD